MSITHQLTTIKREVDDKVNDAHTKIHNLIGGIEGEWVATPRECLDTLHRVRAILEEITG